MRSKAPLDSRLSVRILIIDAYDEAEMYGANFRHRGFDVAIARTAAEGLTAIADRLPDLVIQGLVFPDLPGLELTRRLKERDRAVPIVALSGFTDAATLESVRAAGFALVVTKPCLPHELVRRVVRLLGVPTRRHRQTMPRRRRRLSDS